MKNKIFSQIVILMNYIVVIIIVLIVIYFSMPGGNMFDENFTNEGGNVTNPRIYETEMNKQIDSSPFVGLPDTVISPWAKNPNEYGKVDGLDDGMNANAGLNYNLCSKSCCSQQYPVPFSLGTDPLVCGSEDEFVPTSYTCNNGWQDTGCLCMTKDQALFLNKRGNNG